MKQLNTRVAPSPTGFFHLGTARTAYHNWLMARATGGKFILRIDDTDTSRNNPDFINVILDAMDWLGIDFDDMFHQSDRLSHYNDVATLLLDKGLARKQDGAIFLNYYQDKDFWNDNAAGQVMISDKDRDLINNLVLIRSDGVSTYHFASIIDDIDSDTNLIIRGADHLNNTIKQISIIDALKKAQYKDNIQDIDFTHVGLIMVDKKKLSKRNDASNLLKYRDDNFKPEAILNFILKLGWSHFDANIDKKYPLVNKDLAKKLILDGKFKVSNCNFDNQKLQWLNNKY